MRQQLALRIEATALLHDADALDAERAHALLFFGGHFARHVGELSAAPEALADRGTVGGVAALERAADRRGDAFRILDLGRIGEDRISVDAVGEDAPVAIQDVAAARRRLEGIEALLVGARHHLAVLVHLEIEQPRFDAHGPHRKHHRPDHEARADDIAPVRRRRRLAAAGARAQPAHPWESDSFAGLNVRHRSS